MLKHSSWLFIGGWMFKSGKTWFIVWCLERWQSFGRSFKVMFFRESFPAHKTISWRYKWTQILQSAWKSRAILGLLKILPEIRSGTFTILAARNIMFFAASEAIPILFLSFPLLWRKTDRLSGMWCFQKQVLHNHITL